MGEGRHAVLARELVDAGFSRLQLPGSQSASGGEAVTDVEHILGETSARVQIEGVTTTNEIEQFLRLGVDHVVIGARGIDEPEWLEDVCELYPDSIAVATEVHDRRVVRRGWVRTLPVDVLDLVDELNGLPLREIVLNVRSFDAAHRLRELALLEDVAERSRFPVLVSGVALTPDDCRALEHRGIAGAVIDAARLLDGEIDGREMARQFGA
jgi:phosphoribosylformimino-5-aminoimidazole carboxamide ribotide isomerase